MVLREKLLRNWVVKRCLFLNYAYRLQNTILRDLQKLRFNSTKTVQCEDLRFYMLQEATSLHLKIYQF